MTTEQTQNTESTALYAIIVERLAAFDATQNTLIDTVRENGRRSNENYRALSARMDENYRALAEADSANYKALNAKFDRLIFVLLGAGAAGAGAVIIQWFI